jgi:DNA-binding LacI/PurR family transcriptional regulator
MARVSQRDIAEKCGVSQKTVSLALSDSPRISAERKRQVLRAASELGYQADGVISAAFQRLHGMAAHQNTGTVICAISGESAACRRDRAATRFLEALRAASQARSLGFDTIYPEEELPRNPDRLRTLLRGRGCCGCLLYEPSRPFGNQRQRFFEALLDYPAVGVPRSTAPPQPPVLLRPEGASLIYRAHQTCRQHGFERPALVLEQKVSSLWLDPCGPAQELPRLIAQSLGMPVYTIDATADAAEITRWAQRENCDCLIVDYWHPGNADGPPLPELLAREMPVLLLDTLQVGGSKIPGFAIDWAAAAKQGLEALLAQLAGTIFHNPAGTRMILQPVFHSG